MNDPVKILSLEAENIKRVRAVRIEPTAAGLTIIGGDNNQGKTSVLDAISWALGGDRFRPSKAAREGSATPPRTSRSRCRTASSLSARAKTARSTSPTHCTIRQGSSCSMRLSSSSHSICPSSCSPVTARKRIPCCRSSASGSSLLHSSIRSRSSTTSATRSARSQTRRQSTPRSRLSGRTRPRT